MLRSVPRPPLFPTRRSSDLIPQLQRIGRAVEKVLERPPSVVHDGVVLGRRELLFGLLEKIADRREQRRRGRPKAGVPKPSRDRKSTRLNSSHTVISYAVFCL